MNNNSSNRKKAKPLFGVARSVIKFLFVSDTRAKIESPYLTESETDVARFVVAIQRETKIDDYGQLIDLAKKRYKNGDETFFLQKFTRLRFALDAKNYQQLEAALIERKLVLPLVDQMAIDEAHQRYKEARG